MQILFIPLTRGMQVTALAFVGVCTLMVALTPIDWTWRWVVIGATLLSAAWQWHRYLRWRPVELTIRRRDELTCRCAAADALAIRDVRRGLVLPWLVSVRLIGVGGEIMDLVVPGGAIPSDHHWRLRRALLAWHSPAQSDLRGT